MRHVALACLLLATSFEARANDWEKFYRQAPAGLTPILPTDRPAEVIPLPEDPRDLVDSMWRQGYAVIGVSSFNSSNAATKDAVRFATKLKAAYVAVTTQLSSSRTVDMPLTTPTSTTSYTNGSVSASGTGGYANGNYSGTTTTYGTQTTHIPITVNRFEKVAIYLGPVAKQGSGLLVRAPSADEVTRFESRHLLIVRAIRDGSAADRANLLEGDVIQTINGDGATFDTFGAAIKSGKPLALHLIRAGQPRDITVTLPPGD